jgi:hypothetical protein
MYIYLGVTERGQSHIYTPAEILERWTTHKLSPSVSMHGELHVIKISMNDFRTCQPECIHSTVTKFSPLVTTVSSQQPTFLTMTFRSYVGAATLPTIEWTPTNHPPQSITSHTKSSPPYFYILSKGLSWDSAAAGSSCQNHGILPVYVPSGDK